MDVPMERRRSPRYPFIDLERALALARRLPPKAAASWQDAAKAWGKEESSSRVAQVISALRQFELLEVEGHGPSRQLLLSPLARDLLETGNRSALQHAALSPRIFDELWHEIRSRKTNHAALLRLLTTNRSYPFNPRAAEEVLRIFKKTVKFADLVPDHVDIDELIQSRPRILSEEVIAMGKIRIQYRGELERKDFQEARDHFESKLKD